MKFKNGDRNLRVVLWFGISVALIILISVLLRFAAVLFASKFDGKHRFTVDIQTPSAKHWIVSIEPISSSGSILEVSGVRTRQIGKLLKIPTDGKIAQRNDAEVSENTIAFVFLDTILHYKNTDTNLTLVDLLRLSISSYGLSSSAVKVSQLALPVNDYETDKLMSTFFKDSEIAREAVSIQVINGTDVSGFGNRLARLLSNCGATVIAVSTASHTVKSSRITYVGKKTYTVSRLSRILGFPTYMLDTTAVSTPTPIPLELEPSQAPIDRQQSISDIIIVIGEESASSSVF